MPAGATMTTATGGQGRQQVVAAAVVELGWNDVARRVSAGWLAGWQR